MADITTVYTMTPGETSFSVSDLQPGDTICWVWHHQWTGMGGAFTLPGTPSTHLTIVDSEDVPASWMIASGGPTFLSFSEADGGDSYPNYVWFVREGEGEGDYEAMYLIVYPITGFTAGAYTLNFTLPSTGGTGVIAWGKILRGVDMESMGEAVQSYRNDVSQYEGYVDAPYRLYATEIVGGGVYINDYPYSRSIDNGVLSPAYVLCLNSSLVLKSPQPTEYGTTVPYETFPTASVFCDVGLVASGSYTFVDPGTTAHGAWGSYDGGASTSWLILRGDGWDVAAGPTVYFADLIVFNAATSTGVEF